MHWLVSLLAAQAISVPAYSPPAALPPAVPERLSLVVATTVSETDPQPLCDRPNCTSLFLGRYAQARTLSGPAVETEFAARVEMGSPWIRPYRLALVVEQRPGAEPLVRAMTGFSSRTGQACFGADELTPLGWTPQGAGVSRSDGAVCVTDPD
jgi:hypothetical protein